MIKMKRQILSCLALGLLLSCDKSTNTINASESIRLSPRVQRNASVTDSIWNLAATVHVRLTTTNGTPLLNDTVAFSKHTSPVVAAPSDQGVSVLIEGLSNSNVVVWSGNLTLPPSTRDTAFAVTVDAVTNPGGSNGGPSLGTVNTPGFDSISVISWASADTFDQPVHVFFSCKGTPGATLHYTLDGKTYPNTSSPAYGDTGILVDSSATIQVIATKPGWTSSATITHKVTLLAQSGLTATTNVEAWTTDTYDQPVTVKLTSPTPNAEIRYTLDGTVPTRSSPTYTVAGILIDSTRTLHAVTYTGKAEPSLITFSKSFKLQAQAVTVASVSATPWATNTYDRPVTIKLAILTPNAEIHYTLDGTEPTRSSPTYSTVGIDLKVSSVLKAVAYNGKAQRSNGVLSQNLVLQVSPIIMDDVATLRSNEYWIKMNTPAPGDTIRYTLDGSVPTRSSATYLDSLLLSASATITAVAFNGGLAPSTVAQKKYDVQVPQPYRVALTSTGATYSITFADSISDAELRFTTDGTSPTMSSNLAVQNTAFTIDTSKTIIISAFKGNYKPSIPFAYSRKKFTGMRFVPPGSFSMGCALDSPLCAPDEKPVHNVTVSGFYMDTIEYLAVPSDSVNWYWKIGWTAAVRLCNQRSKSAGLDTVYSKITDATGDNTAGGSAVADFSKNGYRLPTEAEWEYAARAGSTTFFPWGDDSSLANQYASYGDANTTTQGDMRRRGGKKPNAWGIYDMIGNASEWTNDNYYKYPSDDQTDPTGPAVSEVDSSYYRYLKKTKQTSDLYSRPTGHITRGGQVCDLYTLSLHSAYRGGWYGIQTTAGLRMVRRP
jgi:formylglycine-generating enzyme required for sulfatase activity